MTRRLKKLVTHFFIVAALVFSGHAIAQEAASSEDGVRTATVKIMLTAGSYVYLLVNEGVQEAWLATSPQFVEEIKEGDLVEFRGEVEMEDFHSKALNRTFESLWFVGQIRLKRTDENAAE
jgi:hypothetical protein